jgi:flavodoxin
MKILVVYYSLSGNTALIANTIAKEIGADTLELKPQKEIMKSGFMKYLWGGGQVIMKKKPNLLPFIKKVSNYDLIFIGTPVWAWNFTPPLNSFFSTISITDKKVAVFCTHGGNPGQTLNNMRKELIGNTILGEIDFLEPLKSDTQNKVIATQKWAKSISLLHQKHQQKSPD